MKVKDVIEAVQHIRTLTGDPEALHVAEDHLWRAVLEAIRDGEGDSPPGQLAQAALETTTIDSARW